MATSTRKTKTSQDKVLASLSTTSAKIRYLNDQGMSRGEISRTLKIRYQWVRNVLITPVTKPKA